MAWLVLPGMASAQLNLDVNATNSELERALEGPGVSVGNGTLSPLRGISSQYGLFEGGDDITGAGPTVTIDRGVFLVTAPGNTILGSNNSAAVSGIVSGTFSPDPQLATVDAGAGYDTAALQLEVTPSGSFLKFSFVFASDEYPEYVCTVFNDAFGFFIRRKGTSAWQNVSLLPGTSTPIAVNTINGGVCGADYNAGTAASSFDLSNSMLYVDNGDGSTPFNNSHLQYDGFSIPIVVDAAVTAGATYEVKLVIADSGDPNWDSAIFLKWISSSNFANDADIEIDLAVDDNTPFGSAGDIAADHTGVYLDGDVSLPDPANTLLAATPIGAGGEIEDGNYHLVRFVWDPATQTFSYYFDGALAGVFNRDLITYFSSPFVTFGFSAATGASRNEHKACWTRPPTLVPPVLADLSLDIAIAPSTPVAGQPATYSIFVTNDGPDAATNVEVTSLLPTGLSYVDDSSGGRVGSAADYDLTTGLWSVGTLAAGETRKIDISVDVSGAMPIELRAEVSAATEPDPDSIPGTGATNGVDADDGLDADGATIDDDEAVISFTALAAGIDVTGTVFFDTGAGPAATAHDGLIQGDEAGAGGVTVQLVNTSTGDVIDTAKTDGSGGYAFSVPSTLAGTEVTVRIVPSADARNISSAVANMTDASTLDGAASVTLATGTAHSADFGLAPASRLVEGQSVTVTPGGVARIAHTFTAGTAMDVDFSISGLDTSSPGSFTTTLWRDDDCSGDVSGAEAVLSGTQSLAAGEVVCLVARVEASAGLASGATVSFDVMADAVLSGTAETEQLSNADRVTVNDGASLTLTKQVCNASQSTCNAATGAGFGTNNRGAPGEQLVYRLVFENPTPEPLEDVRVYDRTPDYSATIAGGASLIVQPSSVACSLVQPASPVPAGFEGVVEWNCSGKMAPGDRGIASFTVEIAE